MARVLLLNFILFLCLIVLPCFCNCQGSSSRSNVTGLFIFGDSIVDSGNNNYLPNSIASANFRPYGVDFVGPTGRFTNARTVVDVLGELLGLSHYVPCFENRDTAGAKILRGVNYASAGSGILDSTTTYTNVIPLESQITNFAATTLPELEFFVGKNLSSYLAQSMFVFNTGANDYMSHCFMDTVCSLAEFTEVVIENYSQEIKRMYSLGARKFALFSSEVSGCTPVIRKDNDGKCNELYNWSAELFNSHLNASIDKFKAEMPDAHFVFANLYAILGEIIEDPATYGFKVVSNACCETSVSTGGDICLEGRKVCDDRNSYVYFDGGHPTDKANVLLAGRIYSTNLTSVVYPFNIKHLADINSGTTESSYLLSQMGNMGAMNGRGVE